MQHEPSFLSAFLGLIFVLGIIFLISFLFKKFGSSFIPGTVKNKKNSELILMDCKTVDLKNRLILVRCKNKEYLLIIGENNTLIDSFDVRNESCCENQEVVHDNT